MPNKHRIAPLVFLLVFLSAWLPSAIAHAVDPHHDEVASTQTTVHESDHCPYCELELSAYTPFQTHIYQVTTTVAILAPVAYTFSVSFEEPFLVSSRGPPAC